ncbi:MAG: ABC transporter substrate-binding protein [Oscillospiraceae bacterium]|nr:ABC transporter substrate-binding protein [Oscillospiraceae bacterium]
MKNNKHIRRILTLLLVLAHLLVFTACSSTPSGEKDVLKAVIIKQLDHASLDEIANAIEERFETYATEKGVQVEVSIVSGQNDPTILKQLAEQAIAQEADVIIPIATLAAQITTGSAKGTGIPVVYAAISDPEGAGLTSLENVTGTSDALNTEFIFRMIFAMDPQIQKVGLLYSLSEANSIKPIEDAKKILTEKGVPFVEATAETQDEVRAAVSLLQAEQVEAIFTPTDNVIMAAELSIYEDLIRAGIPHYAGADSFVRNGAFATCGVNYTDLGVRTAELALDAALSGTSGMEDYYLMDGGIITVNTETATALGLDDSVFSGMGELVEVITTED